MIDKIFGTLNTIVVKIVQVSKSVSRVIVPVSLLLIASDILLGTKLGVLDRFLAILSKVGLSGNILTIIVVVALVLYFDKQRQP